MTSLLVTLADKNYIDQAKQLFSSVYFNAGWQGDYMLLAHEIPKDELKWFSDKGILIKECLPLFEGKLFNKYPNVILDKFYLFTPEFKKWDNVVFLDADIIVRCSLNKLTKLKGFNTVLDFGNPLLKDQFNRTTPKNYLRDKISKNFNINSPAFNTGVMAFNTNIIQENSLESLLSLFLKYQSICKYGEQPIINLYFYKKWQRLSFLYNFSISYAKEHFYLKPQKINGAILHFIADNKPWEQNDPFYNEWKKNFDKASLIDLKNRQSNIEDAKFKLIYLSLDNHTRKVLFDSYFFTNKIVGLLGITIHRKYPKLYYKLLEIRNKFN